MFKTSFLAVVVLSLAVFIHSCNSNTGAAPKEEASKKEQVGFNGLSDFVIGETTLAGIDTSKFKLRLKTVQTDITDVIKNRGIKGVYSDDWKLLNNGVSMYEVKDFQGGQVSYSNFRLLFYNGKLERLSCSMTEPALDILKAKYPDYKASANEVEKWVFYTWDNEPVKATYYLSGVGNMCDIFNKAVDKQLDEEAKNAKAEYIKKNMSI